MSVRRSAGGTGTNRYDKLVKSKELAEERARERRKEEGRALFEYEQTLKKMGMKPSKEFLKKKEEYEKKLQAEKDQKFRRQAKKRKRREAEAAERAEGEAEEGEEPSAAKRAKVDPSNPFFKKQLAAEAKRKAQEEERLRREKEIEAKKKAIEQSNRMRKSLHKKLQEKTKRGQPKLANHMNYLMHRIKKSVGQ